MNVNSGAVGGGAVARRGRVVFLVDNSTEGDSRTAKTVGSMIDAGWEVIVLGRSPGKEERTGECEGAVVHLLPMPTPLHRARHDLQRFHIRWPLAYPSQNVRKSRQVWLQARRRDLQARRLALGSAGFVDRMYVAAAAVRLRLAGRWLKIRARQTDAAREGRRVLNGRLDRISSRLWRTVSGTRCWRRLEPILFDYEMAFGDRIDKLEPDIIHANDFRLLGVGARAKLRARSRGRATKLVWEAREYLPGLKPRSGDVHWLPANIAHEQEYAHFADAVVTVSDTLAELLRTENRLTVEPAVVLNAPELRVPAGVEQEPKTDVRAECGLGPEVPLLVYSGAIAEQRGIGTMIEALAALEGVHVAVVALSAENTHLKAQLDRAEKLGVRDRVHVVSYVPHWQVVDFLRTADIGVIPIHRWKNHEISLITKFFEYSHARLPIVVSDVKTMAEATRATGQGEVFRAKDVDDYVRAVRAVLADPERYRAAYDAPGLLEKQTWQYQAQVLDEVYSGLVSAPNQRSLSPVASPAS